MLSSRQRHDSAQQSAAGAAGEVVGAEQRHTVEAAAAMDYRLPHSNSSKSTYKSAAQTSRLPLTSAHVVCHVQFSASSPEWYRSEAGFEQSN